MLRGESADNIFRFIPDSGNSITFKERRLLLRLRRLHPI